MLTFLSPPPPAAAVFCSALAALIDLRLWLGLFVASGFSVYDMQRIVAAAEHVRAGCRGLPGGLCSLLSLFSSCCAMCVDTQVEEGEFDSIAAATMLTTDAVDVFIKVVKLFIRREQKKKSEEDNRTKLSGV